MPVPSIPLLVRRRAKNRALKRRDAGSSSARSRKSLSVRCASPLASTNSYLCEGAAAQSVVRVPCGRGAGRIQELGGYAIVKAEVFVRASSRLVHAAFNAPVVPLGGGACYRSYTRIGGGHYCWLPVAVGIARGNCDRRVLVVDESLRSSSARKPPW